MWPFGSKSVRLIQEYTLWYNVKVKRLESISQNQETLIVIERREAKVKAESIDEARLLLKEKLNRQFKIEFEVA